MVIANSIRIVQEGVSKAIIVIPDNPDGNIRPSDIDHVGYPDFRGRGYSDDQAKIFHMSVQKEAQVLAEYIAKSSSVVLAIKRESEAKKDILINIHIGFTKLVKKREPHISDLDDDAFILDSTDRENIIIAGPTCWAIKFGICEFLERYVGIRWLFPGVDGEDVPKSNTVNVVCERIEQKPAFFSRLLSAFHGIVPHIWARFNRMHGRIRFHHGLYRVFPPAIYTKTHPHFFPMQDGVRFLPPDDASETWQPCLTSEEGVEEAIKNICAYFDENKQAGSYSLGMNDSPLFCRCENCEAKMGNRLNFLGCRDLSDYYFEWCNKVVKGVLERHPGKYFGCLAYAELVEPPKRTKIDKHIIPFMTYDRMQYADSNLRAINMQKTREWLGTVGTLGWYDYFFGAPFSVPRIYFHQMAEFIRLGYETGVKAFYAEAYPNWGEGPKLYLALRLMWNPYINVDAILEEWYVRMVGADAAEYLAKYFRLWEEFWSKRATETAWFHQELELSEYNKKFDFLNDEQVGYLDAVRYEDITKSRQLLEAAYENAETELQKHRAKLFLRTFEFYELSALAYLKGKSTLAKVVSSESQALEAFSAGIECFQMVDKRNTMALEEFARDPILCHPNGNDVNRSPENAGKNWGESSIWSAFDWYSKSAQLREQIAYLAQKSESTRIRRQMQFMLMLNNPKTTPISMNPCFEEGTGVTATDWKFVYDTQTSMILRTKEMACTGRFSILCESVNKGSLQSEMEIPARAGTYGAVARVFFPNRVSKGTKVWVTMIPLNSKGQKLRRFLPVIPDFAKPRIGDWNTIATIGELDDEIRGEKVKSLQLVINLRGFEPGEKLYIDSAAIYRVC
ncbi:MAG: hypothetical protein A2Y12_09765 [Planctomycetes bacterium GWF2_42_9]|nr:MAG: hypothetical protein A2Y12_09765 [Planctomycetes bacterium GWF2_42_9]